MNPTRILKLNEHAFKGNAVVYIMSRDQRIRDNHALLAAQLEATEKKVPLYVLFNLRRIEHRAREHYEFMLRGLREVANDLAALNITFILRTGDAYKNTIDLLSELDAGSLYFDFSPLTGSRDLQKKLPMILQAQVM